MLVLDRAGPPALQLVLGVLTFGVLALVLLRQSAEVRAQTLVVVVFAAVVEVMASLVLDAYRYRFHNVPLYVPPAHGLVYLAAMALGRTRALRHTIEPSLVRSWSQAARGQPGAC